MNGYLWLVRFVPPNSYMLVDRTGSLTIGATDPVTRTIYLSNELVGDKLETVLIHELAHCAMFSYGIIDDIRQMVRPEDYIEVEEWVCNFIANYGVDIISTSTELLMNYK